MADFTDDGLYMRHHRTRRGALSARIDDERAERDERDERGAEAPDDSGGGTTTDSPSSSASASASTSSYYAILNVPRDASLAAIKSAYRGLVSTVHPDKIQDQSHKKAAEVQFIRIQTAYDVLKDERLRAVYDVYGEEGLQAGMELSTTVSTTTAAGGRDQTREQKKLFEEYLRQKAQREQAAASTKGVYVFRADASAAGAASVASLAGGSVKKRGYYDATPQITTVYMSTGVDIPLDPSSEGSALDWLPPLLLSEQDSLHLGGMVVSGGSANGGGSFVAGYHRFYGNGVQVGAEGSVGLQTLVGASVSVPLMETVVVNGGVQCDWSGANGRVVSWDVGTSKQLGDSTSAEFAWTVWPLEVSTMSFTVRHKFASGVRWLNRVVLMAKVELGAVTGVTLRVMRQITDVLSGRASVKVSVTQGFEVELGGFGRIGGAASDPSTDPSTNPTTAGLGVVTAVPAGVMLRLRFQKSGHNFEFPMLLSPVLDPTVIIGAHVLPPAVVYAVLRGVVAPASRFLHRKRAAARRARQTAVIQQELASSLEAIEMIRPVAVRKMRREAAEIRADERKRNPVVVKALYGDAELLKDDRIQVETFDSCIVRTPEDVVRHGITVVDVSVPVAYLCENSVVEFYSGFSKSNLLGFFDPCPGVDKVLVIFYWSAGEWFKVELGDTEGARVVPGVGRRLGLERDAAESTESPLVRSVLEDALGAILAAQV